MVEQAAARERVPASHAATLLDGTRRASVGLPPLAEQTASVEAAVRNEGQPPADPVARRHEVVEWERSVGWRDP